MIWMLISALLGALLLLAGIPKLRDRAGMLAAVQGYRLLPAPLERVVAALLPLGEVALGALLVTGLAVPFAPAAASALFLVFFGALAINLLRGRRELDCGCFSFAAAGHAPRIGWLHAVRALVLAAAAAALALAPGGYGLAVTPLPESLLALALAGVVVAAGLSTVALRPVFHPGRRSVDTHLAGAAAELRAHTTPRARDTAHA
ncbi:MauE/DoxX family redox-associated membrane protein [Microbacterium sp. No. 7]|uniref:MauE/DoxX family redox-associated membrane protein n=1 Tax=Microbacterium sp. No. 7 TaxID=1714373 RepID=UPI0006CFE5FA|nr:MauE/DoxX family redox-associated membrane protein [Microbacterium sp. No. 7]ALJ21599.1 methylamine utilization protein [Microbacterium sp. No. 7]